MSTPGWYNRLSRYFREKFGRRITKVPLHAGLTCPNRDGRLSQEGCIFCHNPAFSPAAAREDEGAGEPGEIERQIRRFQWRVETRGKGAATGEDDGPPANFMPRNSYLAYFQSYSNTYGPLPLLERLYREALAVPGVVGLSVATRPDCLEEEVIELLTVLARHYHIWLELGLQSAHDRTLEMINRGHNFASFRDALYKCSGRGLNICAHLINGLPGEDDNAMLETAKRLAVLPLNGVKFHQLQVMAGTKLEQYYQRDALESLSLPRYLKIVCDQLEALPPGVVVHRLLAETTDPGQLLAPVWQVSRPQFANMVEGELRRRGTWQGRRSTS